MARFEIEGNEYELKLTYASVEYLNGLYKGGSFELIGKALMGDLEAFPNIVHAGLFHTGKNFSIKKVRAAIEAAISEEKIDMDQIMKISNEVVTKSFFYKKTVEKILKKDPKTAELIADFLK
ncbi:tail assembly chaperone [Bacillus sonorensis]|uniref:tail assembly chaperone n=1 Tax=Bacillus sonorensis TaxID=119858 RepID=UPI0022E7F0D0|nr:tail assembly chaperone [Bacillus sonorensis]